VTKVLPAVGPLFGETVVTVGSATYVNLSPVTGVLVPPGVVTVTFNDAGCMGRGFDGYLGVGNNNQAGTRRSSEPNSRCNW